MLWTLFSLMCQMLEYNMQFYLSHFLEDTCWVLAFFSNLPINMTLTSWSKKYKIKGKKKTKKQQLSVTFIQDLFSIFKNQSEKIFHSLVLAEPLRKQENPSAKFSIRWYYLKIWSVKLGLQQLTKSTQWNSSRN